MQKEGGPTKPSLSRLCKTRLRPTSRNRRKPANLECLGTGNLKHPPDLANNGLSSCSPSMTVTFNPHVARNLAEDHIFQAPKQSTLLCEDLTCEDLLPRKTGCDSSRDNNKAIFQWQLVRMAIESSHDQKHFTAFSKPISSSI